MRDHTKVIDGKIVCAHCGKEHEIRDLLDLGDPDGNGITLGRNIMDNKDKSKHPLYYICDKVSRSGNSYPAASIQAHHLVASEVFRKNKNAREVARVFGYNINHKKNGIFLPAFMELACYLAMPVHNTNHSQGDAIVTEGEITVYMKYPKAVKKLVTPLIDSYIKKLKKVCEYDKIFINEMNEKSKTICDHILKFEWLISFDGLDYQGGNTIGCGSAITIRKKKENVLMRITDCNCKRNHLISLDVFKEKAKALLSADSLADALKELRAPEGIVPPKIPKGYAATAGVGK